MAAVLAGTAAFVALASARAGAAGSAPQTPVATTVACPVPTTVPGVIVRVSPGRSTPGAAAPGGRADGRDGGRPTSGARGRLALTGRDFLTMLAAGAVLVLAGGLLAQAARSRNRAA